MRIHTALALFLVTTVMVSANPAAAQTCTPRSRTGFTPGPSVFGGAAPGGTVGHPGSASLTGADLHVSGESLRPTADTTVTLRARGTVMLRGSVVVDGNPVVGNVIIEGLNTALSATLGNGVGISRAHADGSVVELFPRDRAPSVTDSTATNTASPAAAAARATWREAISSLLSVQVQGASRVVFVSGTTTTTLAQPVTVTNARLYADDLSWTLPSFTATANKMLIGGEFAGGSVVVDGSAVNPRPQAVAAQGGTITLRPNDVALTNSRVTQVFDADGPQLQAAVQVISTTALKQGNTGNDLFLTARVGERSNAATAHLEAMEVDGCIPLQLVAGDDGSPLYVTELIDIVVDSGWAAPVVLIVALVAAPFVIVADIIGTIFCGLFGCSTGTAPEGYPAWLEPGQSQVFQMYADLDGVADGEYPTTIRFVGKNHAAAELKVIIRVGRGDTPAAWTCGSDSWGTFEDCECGCGAFDIDCPNTNANSCDDVGCGRPSGSRADLLDNTDTTQCLEPPGTWLCSLPSQNDTRCDCGCGIADDACTDRNACFGVGINRCPSGTTPSADNVGECVVVPPTWTCGTRNYGDGRCECGCGAVDIDCADNTIASCDVDRCGAQAAVDVNDIGACVVGVPAEWTCSALDYAKRGSFSRCDCGCGTHDPDCGFPGDPFTCFGGSCGSDRSRPDLVDPTNSGRCLTPDNSWLCRLDRQTDTDCDCGCGIADDACANRAQCFGSEGNEFCPAGTTVDLVDLGACIPDPNGGACSDSVFGDGRCDCGCGLVDPDCAGADACADEHCDAGQFVDFDVDSAACLNGTPEGWTCDADRYNDGRCTCGCGIVEAGCADLSCRDDGCGEASADPDNPAACVVLPAGFFCTESTFLSEQCVCGCGAPSLACPAGAGPEACDTDACDTRSRPADDDIGRCLDLEGWTCLGSAFGTNDGCDCGCGLPDPDCRGAVAIDACDTLTCDRPIPGALEDCGDGGWTCPLDRWADGICDCGCQGVDVDCDDPTDADQCERDDCNAGNEPRDGAPEFCQSPPFEDPFDDDGVDFWSCHSTTGGGVPSAGALSALFLLGRWHRRRRRR